MILLTFPLHRFLGLFLLAFAIGCAPPPPPPALLASLPTSAPTTDYEGILLQNYTYTNGQLIFNPQNIRLGSPSPILPSYPIERHSKGVQLHICLDQQRHDWTNESITPYALDDGAHTLYAFLVNSYHESIKVPSAIFARAITIRQGRLAQSHPITTAQVVYNSPLGSYRLSATDSLLVDFVLVNTTLSPNGNRLQLQLDDQSPWIVDTWQPYALTQLAPGAHRLRLTLVDAAGQPLAEPVEGAFEVVGTSDDAAED